MERKVIESGSVRLVATSREFENHFELFVERDGNRIDEFNAVEVACALTALNRASQHFQNRRRAHLMHSINRSLL